MSVTAVPARPVPRLHVPGAVHDFGEAREGETVSHTFRLENQGGGLLRLQRLHSSCGCTVSTPSSMEIRGGDFATVEVKLDLNDRAGPQEQRIQVHSNDPENPVFTLMLKGNAIPRVELEPRVLNFQRVNAEAPPTGALRIRSTTGDPLRIRELRSQRNQIVAALEVLEEDRDYRISITPRVGAEGGHFSDTLEIFTDDPKRPSYRAVILWQVSALVSVSPQNLSLLAERNPRPVTRYLLVRGAQDLEQTLEVRKVEWQGREMDIVVTDAGNFGWRIEIKDIVAHADMHGEEIKIHTNVPGFELMSVPVRIQR